jgi:hypothetical protein
MKEHTMELYAVMSADGKYLRSRGYGGSGKSWVDTLDKAKTWGKKGTALSQITWWANRYPEYGVPSLVVITATVSEVVDQSDRVASRVEAKKRKEAQREVTLRKQEYDRAQDELREAQARVDRWRQQ